MLDVSEPADLRPVGRAEIGFPSAMDVDVSDPAAPQLAGSAAVPRNARWFAVEGDAAYVLTADDFAGLSRLELADPFAVDRTHELRLTARANGLAVAGRYAYVGTQPTRSGEGGTGVLVVDVGDRATPMGAGAFVPFPDRTSAMAVAGRRLYVYDSGPGGGGALRVLELADPARPVLRGSVAIDAGVWSAAALQVVGDRVYVAPAPYTRDVLVFDVADPDAPRFVGTIPAPGHTLGVAAGAGGAILAQDTGGLVTVRFEADERTAWLPFVAVAR